MKINVVLGLALFVGLVSISILLYRGSFGRRLERTAAGPPLSTATKPARQPGAQAPRARAVAAPPGMALNQNQPLGILEQSQAQGQAEAAFGEFQEWAGRYQAAAPDNRPALEAHGRELALARRTVLADLIRRDPERALRRAVPAALRESLPPSIASLLEEPITTRGDLEVLGVRPLPDGQTSLAPVLRTAFIQGQSYAVFTYGAGETFLTRRDVPLNGIALDASAASTAVASLGTPPPKLLALDPSPARVLEYRELATALKAEPVCSISGKPTETAVQLGTQIRSFCGQVHAQDWVNTGVAASGLTGAPGGAVIAESTATEGRKRMLCMRPVWVDYTSGMTTNDALTHFQNFSNYMFEMSYGKLVLAPLGKGSDVTPSMTLPGSVADYDNTGLGKLYNTCLTVASSSYGYDLSKYDYTYVCTAGRPAADYAGLAFVGGVGFHLANSAWDSPTACHEFGHNLGLNHAHFWDTDLKSIIGAGVNDEYGDKNDPMGGGGSPNSYNSRYKNYLGWIVDSDVVDLNLQGSGQYRLYAFDLDNSSGSRGLKFRRNATQNYWVEFRQRKAGNKALLNGVQLLWTGNANEGSYLLDVRLKGNSDNNAVVIGRTFSDTSLGFHVTPLRLGHTFPESVDVRINVGGFPLNQAPVVTTGVDKPVTVINQTVTFTAVASDPNGDPLAYSWDFGDGDFSVDNSPVTTHIFTTSGEFAVRCAVSDMKGGNAGSTLFVRVGALATQRISGRVFDAQNRPLPGMRVSTDTGKTAMTDSDGSYALAGLAAGSYNVDAAEPIAGSYAFVHPAFNNPVTASANGAGADFIGVPSSQTVTTPLVPKSAAGWSYLDTGVNQGTAWRAPLFDSSFWPTGTAPLGYPAGTPITTLIGYGPNPATKYITYYFRKAFTVANPLAYTSVQLDVLRDDGVVIYINGTEAYRNNMPAGAIASSTLASTRIDAGSYLQASINRGLLVAGNNVIAAEVHQAALDSSDIVFDAGVSGIGISGVTSLSMVYLSSPANQAAFTAPTSVSLAASAFTTAASVSLVEFFADGTKIGESAGAPYGFVWVAPSPGAHRLTAVATLGGGGQITSPPVSIQVFPAPVPAVALTGVADGATLLLPSNVTVQATVAPAGATIRTVQLLVNGEQVGEAPLVPYSFPLTISAPGVYAVQAVAVTDTGASYTSVVTHVTFAQPAAGEQLVSFGDLWKYLDDGSAPATNWMASSFDDHGWSAGPGRLGFGGDGELTTINGGPANARHITTYFRKSLVVTNPARFTALALRLLRDDGAAVYLNGAEVFRDNLLPGLISPNSLAITSIDGAGESIPVEATVGGALLVPGTNVLAVEIHQVNATSTDLGFDLSLAGLPPLPPAAPLYLVQPAAGQRYVSPASVSLSSYAGADALPASVSYYADGALLGAGSGAPPFALTWSNAPVGGHGISAVAAWGSGQTATSAPVNITVVTRPASILPFSSVIIPAGSAWRYWDNLNPVAGGWASPDFDDTAWPQASARFGWGLDGERTALTTGRVTIYFRRKFSFSVPAQVSEMLFQLVRDDGAVVYLNGVEMFRQNMPAGQVTATSFALVGVNTPDESTYFEATVPTSGSGLVEGPNVVAVELHQSGPADPDGGFDLALQFQGTTEPRVYLTTPIEGTSFTSANNTINLQAVARGGSGTTVAAVEFFADGSKLGELDAPPWQFTWSDAPIGPHALTARSHDASGIVTDSPEVHIAVGRTLINTTVLPLNSVWKYLVTTVNQGTTWTASAFNDTSWPSGPARLGYGGDGEVTLLGYGGNPSSKIITTYFRKNVVVTGGAVYTNLSFRLLRDDGAVVWLNGRELYRSNMPTTPINYLTLASTTVGGADEQALFVTAVGTTNLHTGTNVIAVEVHQAAPDSSDLSFNLEVVASGYLDEIAPPRVSIIEADGSLELTWPDTALGYRVFESPTVNAPATTWTLTAGSLVQLPGRFIYTVPAPSGNRYYRLAK